MTDAHHNQMAIWELEEENVFLDVLVSVISDAWRSGHAPEAVKEDALIVPGATDDR